MGIEGFNKWIVENHRRCFVTKKIYNNIYIDLNHLLHNAIHSSRNEKEFFSRTFYMLDILLNKYIATNRIVIAVDGPSPYAKICLQRKRRQMGLHKVAPNSFNSLHLTPGTPLMNKLQSKLQHHINKTTCRYKYLTPKYIILPPTTPDEGELKIFAKLIKHNRNNLSQTNLVVGNDADLIVMAMSLSNITNIDILMKYGRKTITLSISKLLTHYPNRDDFVIMSLMMGNDYLPKLYYTDLTMLLNTHKSSNNIELITNGTFNNKNMSKFFFDVSTGLTKNSSSFNILKYNPKKIRHYLDGLLWNWKMYQTGSCPMYDYTYSGSGIRPLDIAYYFLFNDTTPLKIPRSAVKPLDKDASIILLMPYKFMNLINPKYHSFLKNEISHIYNEELCEICHTYKTENRNLYAEKKALEARKKDSGKPVQLKINNVMKLLKTHRVIHKNDFTTNEIYIVSKHVNKLTN